MASALEFLLVRLAARGISLEQIPSLIRDVLGIIAEGGLFSPRMVNDYLESLGWSSEVLDETCFQLIVYILESEWGYRVQCYKLEESHSQYYH